MLRSLPKLFCIFARTDNYMNTISREIIVNQAITTLREEAEAVLALTRNIGNSFVETVTLIAEGRGRVVITGIGKSADIGRKITSTFNSTGTPSVFMHAADAIHGDLGTITSDDIILCLSKSGNTPEIKVLIPLIRSFGNKLVAIVGNTESYLALHADKVLDTTVEREACPNNLAPTSSTTAQLAMGDALAVALLSYRGFSVSDFAKFHPGGALGKKLYLTVGDLAMANPKPMVAGDASVREVIIEISSKRLGATAVIDNGILRGIITDGDLRRMLQKHSSLDGLIANDLLSAKPKTIAPNELVVDALDLMRRNNITQLLVVDDGLYVGVIHLHDILKEGII